MKKFYFLVLFTVMVIVPALSGFVTAGNGQELKRVILQVDNISCGGCFTNISQTLAPLQGFSGVGANLLKKVVAVDFTPPLTAETIAKTISNQGYPATIESVRDITEKESFAIVQARRNRYRGCGAQESCGRFIQGRTSYQYGGSQCCGVPDTDLK